MITPTISDILPIDREAGLILLERRGADRIREKSVSDFVTEVDLTVQNAICTILAENWPEIQFMGEEKDNSDIDCTGCYWVLDPVDGTTNLIHDFRASVISLALVCAGEPQLGIILNPYTGEEFTAVKGGGAFRNGKSIHVSDVTRLADALVFAGTSPYRRNEAEENFRRIMRVYLASHDVRRFGTSALELCYVACGRADGYFEFGVKPWDIAAGMLILREAGGECVTMDGSSPPLDRECAVVATNGHFTESLRALM